MRKMPTKPIHITILDNNAAAGPGALSFASTPAVNIGKSPSLAVNPVKINKNANRNQDEFSNVLCASKFLYDKSSECALTNERLKNKMPIKTKVILMAQIKMYFHVPSNASLLRW